MRVYPLTVKRVTAGPTGDVIGGFTDAVTVDVQLTMADTLAAPSDAFTAIVDANFSDTLAAQADAVLVAVDIATADTLAAQSDDYSVDIVATYSDTLAAQTDAFTADVQATHAETLAAQTDALATQVDVALADTNAAPTDFSAETVEVGATTVTQTVGTGWTSPANAQGLANGTLATITNPSNVSTTTKTGTLVGTYASLGSPTGQVGNVTITYTYSATIGTLATGSLQFAYSTNSGGAFTNAGPAITATAALTTQTVSITLPVANLSTFQFRAVASATNSATAAATFNLDAVTAAFDLSG